MPPRHSIVAGLDAGAPTWRDHVLCLVRDGDRLLLGRKRRGFGQGYWNGFGGKIEAGETLEAAARRELAEECGLAAGPLAPAGLLHFVFEDGTPPIRAFVYTVISWAGTPRPSDEMLPRWFPVARIPYRAMWEDDRHWFPLYLAGRPFIAAFRFDAARALAGAAVDECLPAELAAAFRTAR